MVAIDPDGRIVDDPPQGRRRGDCGAKALQSPPSPIARRDGDDDRFGFLKRRLEPRLGIDAVEAIGLDPGPTQSAYGFGRALRPARLDPGLALNEPPGAIAEAEEEDLHP